MPFVKYIDENTIENAPLVLMDDKKVYSNPSDETLRAFGCLPLIDCEMPVEEGYTFTKQYKSDGKTVTVVWEKHEIPAPIVEEESPAENVSDESESGQENVQNEQEITEE